MLLMSNFLPKSVKVLIEEFNRLPGIGPKSAQRLAMHLLHSPEIVYRPLGEAILGLKKGVIFCQTCWNIAESNPCGICDDPERDGLVICVVEEILDLVAFEKIGEYKGLYHVLHGALSPVDGIGPEQLKIEELVGRVRGRRVEEITMQAGITETVRTVGLTKDRSVREIILATNPSLEGEATALYIQKCLKEFSNLKITRIARGLPVGADLEYADEITLSRALEGRREF